MKFAHPPAMRRYLLAPIVFSILLGLSACNMPGRVRPTQSGVALIFTAAARTERALLTATNLPATHGTPLPAGRTRTAIAAQPSPGTPTPGTTAAVACDAGKFLGDVTYPDNSTVSPGEVFTKTWKLENTGTCPWTTGYSAVFSGGEAMGAPPSVPLITGSVAPGETVEFSVRFTAPQKAGRYRSEWRLRNAAGQVFGVGASEKPFWAQVDVVVASGLTYDFIARASSAEWRSGPGQDLNFSLPFNGPSGDPNGAAGIVDRVSLEDGATSGKLLLMVPKHENNGAIAGTFPEYTVQPGDRLIAFLGFMRQDGSCEDARAIFTFQAQQEGAVLDLGEWSEACDGRMDKVELDLSVLAGKTVRFILSVNAGEAFAGDYAVWNSARIAH